MTAGSHRVSTITSRPTGPIIKAATVHDTPRSPTTNPDFDRDPQGSPPPGLIRRWMVLACGIGALLPGVAMTIAADVGLGSWQVFEVALADLTGLALGAVIVIESVVALTIAWWCLGQKPGPGTFVLGLLGGPIIQWTLTRLPTPDTLSGSMVMLLGAAC